MKKRGSIGGLRIANRGLGTRKHKCHGRKITSEPASAQSVAAHPRLQRGAASRPGVADFGPILPARVSRTLRAGRGVERLPRQHDWRRERGREGISCIRFLNFPDPIGKGGALIEGLKLAPLADLIGYVDADGATSPEALHGLVKKLDDTGAACVIGSRWMAESVLHRARRNCAASSVAAFIPSSSRCSGWTSRTRNARRKFCAARPRSPSTRNCTSRSGLRREPALLAHARRVQGGGNSIEWTDKIGSKVTQSLMRSSLVMFLSVLRCG